MPAHPPESRSPDVSGLLLLLQAGVWFGNNIVSWSLGVNTEIGELFPLQNEEDIDCIEAT